jgi:DNA-binding GntR family transcriptional regulator
MNDVKAMIESSAVEKAESFKTIGQLIASRLREEILRGEISPGTHIRQTPVAAEFGTSRIPVREALAQLESEGLVSLVPNSGARVPQFDFGEHVELYRIRERLEPLAISESCLRMKPGRIEELRRLAELVEGTAGDEQPWLKTDREFHLATYADAGMPRLLTMIESLWNQTTYYRRTYLHLVHEEEKGIELGFVEHRLIIDALARREADAAGQLVAMHLQRTRARITEHAASLSGTGPSDDPAGG